MRSKKYSLVRKNSIKRNSIKRKSIKRKSTYRRKLSKNKSRNRRMKYRGGANRNISKVQITWQKPQDEDLYWPINRNNNEVMTVLFNKMENTNVWKSDGKFNPPFRGPYSPGSKKEGYLFLHGDKNEKWRMSWSSEEKLLRSESFRLDMGFPKPPDNMVDHVTNAGLGTFAGFRDDVSFVKMSTYTPVWQWTTKDGPIKRLPVRFA